jgi:hypothetical protein
MFATPVRILVVGLNNATTQGMLERWRRSGWGSHAVDSVQEAETVLKTIRFKVILAAEKVGDDSGYELAPVVERQSGNLFISVALSETCLWLPVIEQGARSLGKRAVNPWVLETEVETVLRVDSDRMAGVRDRFSGGIPADSLPGASGVARSAAVRGSDLDLLDSRTPLISRTTAENGAGKHEAPPRGKGTSIHGGDRGIDTPAARALGNTPNTPGKRRVE